MCVFLLGAQQLVPAHLATSPIPTESHLFWISEVEQRTANAEDDAADPDDPPEPPSMLATKKKKRRRKKHKGDPRREELTPPISVPSSAAAASACSAEEIFEMDLSSDEEPAAHVSRWVCRIAQALLFRCLDLSAPAVQIPLCVHRSRHRPQITHSQKQYGRLSPV